MDIEKKLKIYRPYGRGLGDCWLVLNYYIGLSRNINEKVYLSDYYIKKGGNIFWVKNLILCLGI